MDAGGKILLNQDDEPINKAGTDLRPDGSMARKGSSITGSMPPNTKQMETFAYSGHKGMDDDNEDDE